jgi:AcrR family transcriptional regulator
VIEATLSVVKERPLAEVQLRHIAARAGISPGHVLYHFTSKDRILVEALRWSEDALASERARELRELDGPIDRIARWVDLFLPQDAQDPTWKLWLEFWLRSDMEEELRQIPGAAGRVWLTDLRQIVEDGIDRGVFAEVDRAAFAARTHGLLVGLSIGILAGWHSPDEARGIALAALGAELDCALPGTTGDGDASGRSPS